MLMAFDARHTTKKAAIATGTISEGPERPSLTLSRTFAASPERVWAAWTEPESLKRWFAPGDEFLVPLAEADVRVGGRYRLVMQAPDGERHDVRGVYREVVPNRRLVFTWAWHSTPERESLVTVELLPQAGGTELRLSHAQFAEAAARDRHLAGWTGCLGRFERCALL